MKNAEICIASIILLTPSILPVNANNNPIAVAIIEKIFQLFLNKNKSKNFCFIFFTFFPFLSQQK